MRWGCDERSRRAGPSGRSRGADGRGAWPHGGPDPIAGPPATELFAAFRADPGRAAVCSDFDGTLAAIVEDPAAARPVPGAVGALADLAERYGVVAVVSGRPATFLHAHLPATVGQYGLYGLERVVAGTVTSAPEAARWRAVVDRVAGEAAEQLEGIDVEHKGLSLTLHFRTRKDRHAAAVATSAYARRVAAETGLAVRPARMSIELHPPIAVDKGTVLAELAAGLDAACFIGDDAGDLPAFAALDRLEAGGLSVARVAVRSAEAPAGLLERADLVVDGPAGVVALLRSL